MRPETRRALIIFIILFAVLTPLAVILVNNDVNLSGAAVITAPGEPIDTPPGNDSENSEEISQELTDSGEQPVEEASEILPTAVPPTPIPPTAVPPTSVPPTTEIPPSPTLPESTAEATEIPSGLVEATETPTSSPDETEIPTLPPESTSEAEITPEATDPPELTPEATAELELTPEATPEITPEATEEASGFGVTITCAADGITFVVSNLGDTLSEPIPYSLDGAAAGQLVLAAGESAEINAGYGTPTLNIAELVHQPETPCTRPPDLSITAECTLDSGVTFVVTNTGGVMEAEEAYLLTQTNGDSLEGSLLLGEGESMDISAGYGEPRLSTGALDMTFEPACDPPAHIEGQVWYDSNGDGQHSEGEAGIAGVVVALINRDGFPVQTVTLEDGRYNFFPVGSGSYTVQVQVDTLPPELEASSDPDGSHDSTTTLDVRAGENYFLNFGYVPTGNASISGTIWLETGNFGVQDADEKGLSGVIVQLYDVDEVMVAESVVAVDGMYRFENLRTGDYTVRLASSSLPQPFGVTFNNDERFDLETPVSVGSGQHIAAIDFGIVGTF